MSKKNTNQIVARDSTNIKNKFLITYSKKNFKVYFLFIIFYFDLISTSKLLLFIPFSNKTMLEEKPSFSEMFYNSYNSFSYQANNGLYKEKKDYKKINISLNFKNDPRPIHFFKVIKKRTLLLRPLKGSPKEISLAAWPCKTLYQPTHYSLNSERFIEKRVKLIRVLKTSKITPFSKANDIMVPSPSPYGFVLYIKHYGLGLGRDKDIKMNSYKSSFINFYKILGKNIIDSKISFYKILFKSSLNIFNIFLINLIEKNLNPNLGYFRYKNKFEKIEFEYSPNQCIWYFKFYKKSVIYIFNKILTFFNLLAPLKILKSGAFIIKIIKISSFLRSDMEKTFLSVFFSNYFYLNILIIKQDKNLPYSLKIIYLNLHFRIWSVFKLLLTNFFYFLFQFTSTIFNTDSFSFFKTKLLKKYALNTHYKNQTNSIIKKNRKLKIEKYFNQSLWQLNKKNHNQNSLNWIFKKYWLNISFSLIISNNLIVYYSLKSNNISLFKIGFKKLLLTQKTDSNLIYKIFFFQSNILNNFKITYKVYFRKMVLKDKNFVSLNIQKNVKISRQIDSYMILLDKKALKITYFLDIQLFNLVKYNILLTIHNEKQIKYQPIIIILFQK